jgi:hypothetical protein
MVQFSHSEPSEELVEYDMSVAFLACVIIGVSDTAFSNESLDYWHAQFSDLTPDGLALVEAFKQLYPEGRIDLLTWLDT